MKENDFVLLQKKFEKLGITDILLGIEIECEFSAACYKKITDQKLGIFQYHSSARDEVFGRGYAWVVERDASLRALLHSYVGEFISKKLLLHEIDTAYEQLKNFLQNDFFVNQSCGMHHHFSFSSLKKYDLNILRKLMRRHFLKQIKESSLDDEIKQSIKKNYFRRYARKVRDIYHVRDRYVEFNRISSHRLEWRSINAIGCKSVEQLREITFIVLSSILAALKEYTYFKECIEYDEVDRKKREIEELYLEDIKNKEVIELCV